MSEIDELKERVARACRVLGRLDLTKAAMGHVSARIPGSNNILLRARGAGELGVRYTEKDQVVEVGLDGNLVQKNDTGLNSPIEVFIHTEVYRMRPDVHSVIHIHPPTVVLFTICNKPLLPLYGAFDPASLQLALDGIPTYPSSVLIDKPELGVDVAKVLGDSRVCLMRGHGITTAAPSVEEAALAAIHINELATMNYQAQLLGDPVPISREDQEAFRDNERGPVSKNGGPPGGRPGALWRYYCAFTGS
jgi:ribulose-5-phosphate 4-epimerase/fuculose-1-phosphate aldolase